MNISDAPILSLVTFLPMVGALIFIAFLSRRGAGQHPLYGALDDAHHVRGLAPHLDQLRSVSTANFQFVEEREWLGRHQLQDGRRRHLDVVRHPDHVPDAALHPGLLGRDRGSRARST